MNADSREGGGLARGVVGSARVIAFGASNVAPAGSVVAGLVIVVSYAGFASPLVVLIAFAAAMCCASSIAEFARRLPSAGSLYTYGSRGLRHLADLLHFTALGWLCLGGVVAVILRAGRPSSFETMGRVFMPADGLPACAIEPARDLAGGPGRGPGNDARDGDGDA